ncbi:MAG TPA: DEAD/DEAH box helicase family protein, partial [Bacilli bacterium]|nr:DEAD/DEAH box helicase family protein [Bacilli bacterium]
MFKLISKYEPAGDQPQAIEKLVKGIESGIRNQVLLGATGTGKTFTIANVIAKVQKPTLILAHNKTLAGQLYAELKELFPENKVEYFVSYYDYYQPEAYVPSKDMYIEKDSAINEEIDELRHAATSSLINNRDVIVVASVSCIYGIGEKEEYIKNMLTIQVGDKIRRNDIINQLVNMTYERNDIDFQRGTFRVRGNSIDLVLANENRNGIKIDLLDDQVERICRF